MDLIDLGAKRVLVVIDPALTELPTGHRVRESLQQSNIEFEIFDQVSDGIVKIVLFCAIGTGLMGGALGDWTLLMGLVAGLAVAATFTLRFEMERRQNPDAVRQPKFAGFEIEDILYLVAPITWLGGLLPFLVLSSIGAPLFLIYQIWVFWRQSPQGGVTTH